MRTSTNLPLAGLLLGAALLGVGGRAEARVIGRSAEISVGREVASQVERFYTVDRDPIAVARVRQIGRRLAANAKDADFPFEFHVVEDATVNAFALPGGFIYVFRGLLQLVPNDDALAFVLAHEISHATRRHAINQFEKNVLLSAGITAILAGTGGGFGGPAQVVQVLAGLSFTRSDEKDADDHGIELMTQAGFNPRSAAEAMELVKRAGGDGKSIPALLRTHPAPDSRIRSLTAQADELLAQRKLDRAEAPPPPPAPAEQRRKLAGLDAVEVGPCAWLPLRPGARWVYRVQDGAATETSTTVRVLDEVTAEPAGVYRVEWDLGRGVRAVRLLAPAGDRYVSRAENGTAAWRLEAVFAAGEQVALGDGLLRYAGTEKVRVPAGEYETVKVERRGADGKPETTLWFARGVGLVRKVSAATGAVQELTSFAPGK